MPFPLPATLQPFLKLATMSNLIDDVHRKVRYYGACVKPLLDTMYYSIPYVGFFLCVEITKRSFFAWCQIFPKISFQILVQHGCWVK